LIENVGEEIGEPEDYVIWEGRHKLADPLRMGEQYDIIARTTPGRTRQADVSKPKRRISFDAGIPVRALAQAPKSGAHLAPDAPLPVATRTKAEVEGSVPLHMRESLTYQATDAPAKEWRGFFSDDDTEDSLETGARRVLGLVGNWRHLSFWRDHEGARIVMTNKRKEVTLRYRVGDEEEVYERIVDEHDTPPQVIVRAGKQGNFYVTDLNGIPSAKEDRLFGYATFPGAPSVKILHGSALKTLETRPPTPKKDVRIRVELRFGDNVQSFERIVYQSYEDAVDDNHRAHGLPESWQIASVRAEEDRIIIVCEDGTNPFWFSEKMCPPIKLVLDKIYANATRVPLGSWGVPSIAQPQVTPMVTRSQKSGLRPGKCVVCHVVLQVRSACKLYDLGEIDEYDEAVPAAIQKVGTLRWLM
jgi:hypothetical protein